MPHLTLKQSCPGALARRGRALCATLLVCGALAACGAITSGQVRPRAARVDDALSIDDGSAALALVPQEARMIGALNLERLRASPVFDALLGWIERKERFARLRDNGGLDLRVDLSHVLFFSLLVDGGDSSALVVHGGHDVAGLVEVLGDGLAPTGADASGLYRLGDDTALTSGDERFVVGDTEAVLSTLELRREESALAQVELGALLERVDREQALWLVLHVDRDTMHPPEPMRTLRVLLMSVDLRAGFALDATLVFEDAESATRCVDELRAGIATAQADLAQFSPALAAALGAMHLEASGDEVALRLVLNAPGFEEVLRTLGAYF